MEKVIPPLQGIKYALFRSRKVVFEHYQMSKEEALQFSEQADEEDLLELHMFNETEEYRVINSRVNGRMTLLICDDHVVYDDCYIEEVFAAGGDNSEIQDNIKQTVRIVNYITYDKNDLLKIQAYRLQEVK